MDEDEAISKLESLMWKLEAAGHDVSSIQRFFDVGEWLIAFEGVENVRTKLNFDEVAQQDIELLQKYYER